MPDDKYKDSSNGVLFDKFGLPPFSVLDSKQGYWVRRKKEWKDLGIKADGGRDSLKFLPSTETRPSWVRYNKESLKGKSNISIFDPVLTEVCYKWFCPKGGNILDPFTGGSVRGIVASQLGYRYTGFDIREEQIKANYNNLETRCPEVENNNVSEIRKSASNTFFTVGLSYGKYLNEYEIFLSKRTP